MRTVQVAMTFPASVEEAESCWYDTTRWPQWVHGLERVVAVSSDWPHPGATVSWESSPAGRGSVREQVLSQQRLVGQQLEVQDGSIHGRQTVRFAGGPDGVEVALALEYAISKRSLMTPVLELLFVGRAMASSMNTTLSRFGAELASRRARASAT